MARKVAVNDQCEDQTESSTNGSGEQQQEAKDLRQGELTVIGQGEGENQRNKDSQDNSDNHEGEEFRGTTNSDLFGGDGLFFAHVTIVPVVAEN